MNFAGSLRRNAHVDVGFLPRSDGAITEVCAVIVSFSGSLRAAARSRFQATARGADLVFAKVPMRYNLLALVHGATGEESSGRRHVGGATSLPAMVEFVGESVHKRVIAVIDTAHALSGDEIVRTARMMFSQLQRTFARRGLSLSGPELVRDRGFSGADGGLAV